jgi:hypothetical protein
MTETDTESTARHYGKDCPVGMVQVEFVGTTGERYSDYGWTPGESAFLELYVDGKRYRVDMGTFLDTSGKARRGLHIVADMEVSVDQHSINAVDIFIPSTRGAGG